MSGKITKQELRKDPVLEFLTKVMNFIVREREKVLWGVVIVVAACVVGFFLFSSKKAAPPQVKLTYYQAVSLYMAGDTINSIEFFRQLAETAPDKDEGKRALYYLGQYSLKKGDIEEAEKYFNRFLKSSPKDPLLEAGAWAALAAIEFDRGNLDKAVKLYIKARELAPFESQKAVYLYKAALAAEAKGDYKMALDFLQEFEEKYKDHPLMTDVRGEIKYLKGAIMGTTG